MKLKKLLVAAIPLLIFIILLVVFNRSLDKDPTQLDNNLIGKTVPNFALPSLQNVEQLVTNQQLPKMPFLLNVWATWCGPCHIEHPYLMKFANQVHVPIVGLNYKDQNRDALAFLQAKGNPYQVVISDTQGSLAIDLGVIGAPETFIVDGQGIIRDRYIGVVDDRVWETIILPQLKVLNKEHKAAIEDLQ